MAKGELIRVTKYNRVPCRLLALVTSEPSAENKFDATVVMVKKNAPKGEARFFVGEELWVEPTCVGIDTWAKVEPDDLTDKEIAALGVWALMGDHHAQPEA